GDAMVSATAATAAVMPADARPGLVITDVPRYLFAHRDRRPRRTRRGGLTVISRPGGFVNRRLTSICSPADNSWQRPGVVRVNCEVTPDLARVVRGGLSESWDPGSS